MRESVLTNGKLPPLFLPLSPHPPPPTGSGGGEGRVTLSTGHGLDGLGMRLGK